MIAGIVGTMVSTIVFGFSSNYWMAILSRFFWGLVSIVFVFVFVSV